MDRFRTLLELGTRAELFGCEAASLLQELNCTSNINLEVNTAGVRQVIRDITTGSIEGSSRFAIPIGFGAERNKTATLSFTPLDDPKSKLSALSFKRVIEQLLAMGSTKSSNNEREIVWTSTEGTAAPQGAVFASDAMLSSLGYC